MTPGISRWRVHTTLQCTTIQCTTNCTLHTVHYSAMHTIAHCTLHTALDDTRDQSLMSAALKHSTLHYSALHTAHYTMYTMYSEQCTLHTLGWHRGSVAEKCTVQCSALHCNALHCNVLHCNALHCNALHWIAHCTVYSVQSTLQCIVQFTLTPSPTRYQWQVEQCSIHSAM